MPVVSAAHSTRKAIIRTFVAISFCGIIGACAYKVVHPPADTGTEQKDWIARSIAHLQRMRHDRGAEGTTQTTPPVIAQVSIDKDPSGSISTLQANGPTTTAPNAFFQNLGTNDRTCFSCHQPEDGWGIGAASVQKTFDQTHGKAPIFRPVDGATCATADTSTEQARRAAYALLLDRGLIRIALPVPNGAEFTVAVAQDQYQCNTNPVTGLTSPTAGIISTYRRPLPSTNLGFLNTIMWDGREASLESQAADATTGHAQAPNPPSAAQVQQIVAFESQLLTAQIRDNKAGQLDQKGATGGPSALTPVLASFFGGINDPLGGNPKGTPFTSTIFTEYNAWASLKPKGQDANRVAVARGQTVFNTKPINITAVTGLNDTLNKPSVAGFCGTCHDTPSVGNHSVKLPVNIGIAGSGPFNAATGTGAVQALDTAGLPVFTLSCVSGPLAGKTFTVTDPGKATISGKCADIGKFKGPILRGLASRAPYFHNGSARSLDDVVDFYDQRFSIGFTAQEKKDLVAFLKTL